MVPAKRETDGDHLRPILETLLFVAADPVPPERIARARGAPSLSAVRMKPLSARGKTAIRPSSARPSMW